MEMEMKMRMHKNRIIERFWFCFWVGGDWKNSNGKGIGELVPTWRERKMTRESVCGWKCN